MFLGFLRIESEDTTVNYTNMIMQMLESEAEMSRTASGGCVVREENVVKVSCQESAIRTESEKVKYQYEMMFQFTQAMEYAKDGNLVWECKGELKWNAWGLGAWGDHYGQSSCTVNQSLRLCLVSLMWNRPHGEHQI